MYLVTTLSYRVVRSAGTLGEVSAVWELTPMDTNTFQIVTGTATLAHGQQTAIITVSVSQNSRQVDIVYKTCM